jgi:hypothetical protein
VQSAVRGSLAQIRHMEPSTATALLQVELHRVAEAYGARSQISREAMRECIHLVLSKFSGLGIHEILEAYRMKAAGELHMPKGKGEMWGGEWNANQLGEVLAAYMEQRRLALTAYNRLKHEQEEAAKKAALAEKQRAEFLQRFPQRVEEARQAEDWRKVPEYIFDKCLADGIIKFAPGEAQGILEDARELARLEHQNEIEEAIEAGRPLLIRHLRNLEPEDLEGRAKVIARKLSLFRKLKQQ